MIFSIDFIFISSIQDRSNCLIEAAKGGHIEIVKLLLEYPKSVTQRTQTLAANNSVQPSQQNLSNENDQEESLTANSSQAFDSIGDTKKPSLPIQVSKNLLDIHQTNGSDTKSWISIQNFFLQLIHPLH